MILYNVTIKIDSSIKEEWIKWMQEVHIPEVMETGLFTEYKFMYLLDQDEGDGITFAVQYLSKTMADYEKYKKHFAPALQQKVTDKYEGTLVAFRTVMEVL